VRSGSSDDSLLFIGLPPFNPRLLVPPASPRVQARSFGLYSPGSVHGKMLKWCGAAAAKAGLMHLAGRALAAPVDAVRATEEIRPILDGKVLADLQDGWKKALGKEDLSCALSLGEPTPYRKITALVFGREGEPLAVAKAGCTPAAAALIANERAALETVGSMATSEAVIPALLGHGKTGPVSWILETPLLSGRPSPNALRKEHSAFLAELARGTVQKMPLDSSDIWTHLQRALDSPDRSIKAGFEAELIRQLQSIRAEDADRDWPFTAAHGDFTPWNMRAGEGRIALFDWEYFLPAAPAGWDLLYFIIRVQNLIAKKPLERIWGELEAGAYHDAITRWEKEAGLQIPDRRILASLVIMTIAFDSVPEWICGDKSSYADALT